MIPNFNHKDTGKYLDSKMSKSKYSKNMSLNKEENSSFYRHKS